MLYTISGIMILAIGTEIGTFLFNKKTEKILDEVEFDDDFEFNYSDDLSDEESQEFTNIEKIQFFLQDILEKLPITNLFIAYDTYLDAKEYAKNQQKEQQENELDHSKMQKKSYNNDKDKTSPAIILFTYKEQERKGEILYHIYNGIPKTINATGDFSTLSLLEQSSLVRGQYQKYKDQLDDKLKDTIDDILETPRFINGIEELLDAENVFIGDLENINNKNLAMKPYQTEEKTSYINPKIIKKK